MTILSIILISVGALCAVVGALIVIKKNPDLIPDNLKRNVSKSELPAYAQLIGAGLILLGAGLLVSGVYILISVSLWWIPLIIGAVAGIAVLITAQMKYNGSIF